jgi:hypothetical protein
MIARESKSDSDSNEDSNEGTQPVGLVEGESKFGDTELEDLVMLEGPQQVLQLTLQKQADDFMKEEITDADDYADWIQWAADAEQGKQTPPGATNASEMSVILQVQQMDIVDSNIKERIADNHKEDSRWGEICQKIRIDQNLDKEMGQQLWRVLEWYQGVFAWNKGELGCCTIGEHTIDTQGFPPCKVAPGRLSYWEEAEVKRQINVLVELGKMKPSDSEYACRVTLPVKKDGSRRFCGDYRPLNLQTRRDSFPMPLVDDVISQLGRSARFTALDSQSGFWQIKMAPKDMRKTALITKSGLYDWTVMPFGLKNATSTFTRTMTEVFKDLGDTFLKVFVDDLNVHSEQWQAHLQHLGAVLSRLREVNLKLNPSKCCFVAKSIVFLGHVVSKEGTRPDPGKIDAGRRFPEPTTVTSVRSFLGLTGYSANVDCWDEHLAKVLFGYRCGVQASTRFSPFMILTGRSPHLRADNCLNALTDAVDDEAGVEHVAAQFLEKVRFIASIHESVLLNVEQAQKKQRSTYANRKGKHLFEGLIAGETMVKMKKPGKKRALATSWEGPYQFMGHVDGKGNYDFEEGSRLCIIQDADGRQWERSRRDLQIYHVQPD